MFAVTVRDHIMIAHSFRGAVFGPAQALHGATFTVDAEFCGPHLTEDDILIDIGRAGTLLREILTPLNFRNLDDDPAFTGRNTTTEFMARIIWQKLATAIAAGALEPGGQALTGLTVTLHESPLAWARYTADLPA